MPVAHHQMSSHLKNSTVNRLKPPLFTMHLLSQSITHQVYTLVLMQSRHSKQSAKNRAVIVWTRCAQHKTHYNCCQNRPIGFAQRGDSVMKCIKSQAHQHPKGPPLEQHALLEVELEVLNWMMPQHC